MARLRKHAKLDSRSARLRLPVSSKPVYVLIGRGVHLGYRKNASSGRWVMRQATAGEKYKVEVIGEADDILDANGTSVLDYFQAQGLVQKRHHADQLAVGRDPRSYTIAQCMADYLQYMEARGSQTIRDANSRTAALILPELAHRLVAKVTPEELRSWLLKLSKSLPRVRSAKEQGAKFRAVDFADGETVRRRKASANRTFTILKAALNHAYSENHVASDAAWRKVRPFRGADAARTRYLSLPEIELLLQHSNGSFGTLVRAALHTGARYSELTRLQVMDFDPSAGTLRILLAKAGKPRVLHLTAEGVKFFENACVGLRASDLILTRDEGEGWGPSHQIRRMKEVCNRAGLSSPASFHQLRHTYASHAAMNGMPLKLLADNLGHSDTRMVEKHYGHMSDEYRRTAIQQTALRF